MNASKLLIPALSTCLLAAGAAPAAEAAKPPRDGGPPIHKAYFKAQIEGVQTNSWDATQPGAGGCDTGQHSQGTEVARFSGKPFGITVTYFKGLKNPVIVNTKGRVELYHPVTARVTRRATHVSDPAPAWCEGTDGRDGPAAKALFDCGTKTVSGGVALSYSLLLAAGNQRIGLTAQPGQEDPFVNCAGASVSFPTLLEENTAGKPITSKLPRNEVFDNGLGKIIVLGKGKKVSSGAGPREETTLSWKVTLRRIKK